MISPPLTRPAPPLLREGWPVLFTLYGFVAAWLLGVSGFVWIAAAVPMALHLWSRESIRVPPGFGVWMFFLVWVGLSATQIGALTRGVVLGHRAATYLAAGVAMLYVYNLRAESRAADRIPGAVSVYWLMTVAGGWLAILAPGISLTSVAERLLPGGLLNEQYVHELVHPVVAQVHDFLGFAVARPAAPFASSNEWGSTLGLFLPVYLYWTTRFRGWRRVVLLSLGASAVVPAVQSLNRGLWVSMALFAVYAAVRYALQGRARPLFLVVAAAAVAALVLVATPLGSLIDSRSETGHSDTRRLTLYELSIDAVLESPVVGHGGPVPDPDNPDRAPAGTHGQIWLVSVLHGIPAAVVFVAFFTLLAWRTRLAPPTSPGFWANATFLLVLVQMFFYSLIPSQLPVVLVLAGLAMRDLSGSGAGVEGEPA